MEQLICIKDFEDRALSKLDQNARDYYRSGANDEVTLRDNVNAFSRYIIRPRFLVDVSRRDLSTTVLGQRIAFPVCIAPTAFHKLAHPDGEVATARAAAAVGTCYTQSTLSTVSVEEVQRAAPDGLRWFQLYVVHERDVTLKLIRRVEQSGFKALVLTVDAPTFGNRLADARNHFALPPNLKLANFESLDDEAAAGVSQVHKGKSSLSVWSAKLVNPALQWSDVTWLKSITRLPVVVKGILTAEDAREAVAHGVDGIVVSNHGGRQLDCAAATIDVLREVVSAAGDKCEVYLDGGVRRGTDVLIALALGARAVFVGRPVIWGLACGGYDGVVKVLKILQSELDLAMELSGVTSVSAGLRQDLVVHQSQLSRL